jgi:hypothetical protein
MQPTVTSAAVATPDLSTDAKKNAWYEAEVAAITQIPGRLSSRSKFLIFPPTSGAKTKREIAPIDSLKKPTTAGEELIV